MSASAKERARRHVGFLASVRAFSMRVCIKVIINECEKSACILPSRVPSTCMHPRSAGSARGSELSRQARPTSLVARRSCSTLQLGQLRHRRHQSMLLIHDAVHLRRHTLQQKRCCLCRRSHCLDGRATEGFESSSLSFPHHQTRTRLSTYDSLAEATAGYRDVAQQR